MIVLCVVCTHTKFELVRKRTCTKKTVRPRNPASFTHSHTLLYMRGDYGHECSTLYPTESGCVQYTHTRAASVRVIYVIFSHYPRRPRYVHSSWGAACVCTSIYVPHIWWRCVVAGGFKAYDADSMLSARAHICVCDVYVSAHMPKSCTHV